METANPEYCGDWSTVGQPLMLTHCTGCHSSALTGDARRGAPVGVDLETLEGVQALQARVQVRAVEQQDMPAGGSLSAEDRERLARWLSCGAPGHTDAVLPSFGGVDTTGLSADDVAITVSSVGISERQVLRTRADGRVLLEERFLVAGEAVLFVGYDLRLEGAGRAVWFDRPLPLQPPETGETTWTAEVQAEVGEGQVEAQTWTLTWTEGATVTVDGRSEDRAPVQITATREDGTEQHRWLVSETHVFSGRMLWTETVALELLRLDTYVPSERDDSTPYPPEVGDSWSESAVWGEGAAPWWE